MMNVVASHDPMRKVDARLKYEKNSRSQRWMEGRRKELRENAMHNAVENLSKCIWRVLSFFIGKNGNFFF